MPNLRQYSVVMRHTVKPTFVLLIIFQLFACNSKRGTIISSIHTDTTQFAGLNLSLDSGFINKRQGLSFLLLNSLADTAHSGWRSVKENDTICKYYKVKDTGNYFMCFIDLTDEYSFATHLIIEVTADGRVIKNERFFHANYPCCWLNYFEGFSKYSNYFGIKTCGTGSGYCGSYLYLFKELLPQDSLKPIPQQYLSSTGGAELAQNLSSVMEFKNGNLIMHYKLNYCENEDMYKFRPVKTKAFDVKYMFISNRFTTRDSSKFDGLDVFNYK